MTFKEPEFVDFIADFVANIGGDGLEFSDEHIIIRSENDLTYIQEAVNSLVGTLGGVIDIDYKMEEKENQDWVTSYQNSVAAIEVGKFYIHPSWNEAKEGKINIKIIETGNHNCQILSLNFIGFSLFLAKYLAT